jgi:hypothetical protein
MRRQDPPWGNEEAEGVSLVTGVSPEVTLEERLRVEQQARISARASPEGEVLVEVTEPPRRRAGVPAHNLASTMTLPEDLGEDDEEGPSHTGEVDEG